MLETPKDYATRNSDNAYVCGKSLPNGQSAGSESASSTIPKGSTGQVPGKRQIPKSLKEDMVKI